MASRDAYQKLCGLIADPGSSYYCPKPHASGVGRAWPNLSRDPIVSEVASAVKTCYSHSWILGQVVYVSDRIILGAEHLAKKKASSHKLQAPSLTRLKDSVG